MRPTAIDDRARFGVWKGHKGEDRCGKLPGLWRGTEGASALDRLGKKQGDSFFGEGQKLQRNRKRQAKGTEKRGRIFQPTFPGGRGNLGFLMR